MDIDRFTDNFVDEWNGKVLNVNGAHINFDGRYGTQCMDLWNYWWTELGLTGITRSPDAAAVWENSKGTYYVYFDGILPDSPAKKGDVFIYNRKAWGTGYGHIGIVLEDLGDSIRVFETNGLGDGYEDEYLNQYGSPPRIHVWPKTNLYGYLRYIQEGEYMPAEQWYSDMIHAQARIDQKTADMYDRVFGRDVQRWYNPDTNEVRTEPFEGGIPARSSDVHDIISTNNLIVSQTNTILEALGKLPQIPEEFITDLKTQLSDQLKETTKNISVTITVDPPK